MEKFDTIIVGGGIFGCYAALWLAGRGAKVALLEKEARLFQKASLVNQARLHGGYHYPRSLATAAMSDEHKERFTAEHRAFINFSFEKYYAIEQFGSFTDARQFERFCERLNIRCERVREHALFNFHRLEALYCTQEYSFDPVLLREYYRQRVENEGNIQVFKPALVETARPDGADWKVSVRYHDRQILLCSPVVINATYAATNAINRLFGVRELDLTHEISEIAFITSRQFGERGLTVMDGAFGSIMPYGLSGLLSLSSVAYTHHKISYDRLPRFDCQQPDTDPACRPEAPGICTTCQRRPPSNARKMLAQMRQYFSEQVEFEYLFSYFTIKSKLQANYIDDGRPTEIARLRDEPRFYCLFAGKINSIYEIEKLAAQWVV
ncbi:MAG: FAD-dependent oxidoreductase [Saprospiraceae bacterium]